MSKPATQATTETKKEEKKTTDYSKLDTVNVSFSRPAKWYMYVVKQVLVHNKKVDIKARPSAAAQVVRVAEALKRLGYITYLKYQTTTQINDGKLQRFIVVSVQKTDNFDKLYKEREEERAKKLAEIGKTPVEKK
jgi:hypothetical protein